MRDKQAQKEIKSLRYAMKRLGDKVGVEVTYWPDDTYWVSGGGWVWRQRKELKEIIEKFDALVDALGFEFERRLAELIAKKKSEE